MPDQQPRRSPEAQDRAGGAAQGEAPNYKKTLNLPKTAFSMKANLVQSEPASMKRWDKTDLHGRIRAARAGAPRFRFHDGPPYANGNIHLGHLLNKVMKDLVVRSRTMMGFDCPYIPGWDCHGLPIEHQVMQALIESGKIEKIKTLDEDARRAAVRSECQRYAEKFVKLQAGQMQRLLTLADYDHPYLTMSPEYEGAAIELFADIVERGIVFRKLKSVHWSPANETALAEAELEYYERDDPSVYVAFEATDIGAAAQAFDVDPSKAADASFLIWTTTPWTLPANVAIAVHPRVEYALATLGDRRVVVARELLERVAKVCGGDARIIATTTGERLVGLRYGHPFVAPGLGERLAERDGRAQAYDIHRLVAADYVTTEDGTGLVHTAPGHGADDYQTGVREDLPIYCPVGPDGVYDDTAPEWVRTMSIWKANPVIVEHVRDSGHLLHSEIYRHSYPHDWRGKTPVIFRATEQWFIGVDTPMAGGPTLREAATSATDGVSFIPAWGRNRLRGMLEQRPDWCISRQRSWGLPIPAFRTPDGDALLTAQSVRAVAKVFREEGSTAWLTRSPAELLRHYDPAADPDAPRGLEVGALEKMHDIFDVWFESGSSWRAAMQERGLASIAEGDAVELYLEGSDQHRGWFQSSLLCAVGGTGHAPYKALLTHGFMVDKDGRKMSKSLGNTINVEDLMQQFGADVARWWVATLAYENDIKVDISFIETAGEAYRKIRNTLRFMLSTLDDFTPSPAGKDASCGEGMCISPAAMPPTSIDAWALGAFDRLATEVKAAYERYDFKTVSSRVYDFCNDTLSATYLAAVKDRLYCDAPDSERRRRTQSALWDLTDGLCRLLAPILPHTADEAWRALTRAEGDEASVHLTTLIESFGAKPDGGWARVMEVRDSALLALEQVRAAKGVENPLDAGLTLPDSDGTLARFDPVDLADLLGVSRVRVDEKARGVEVHDLRDEPRCMRSWKRDGTVKQRADGGMLTDRDAAAVGVV
jgi:isoleucyl-tRNA synthetase